MTSAASATPEEPRKRFVDAEAVGAAAVALAERGALISVTAVRNELGNGSNETVAKYLRLWAAKNMPLLANKATAPNWTARELEGMSMFRELMRAEAAHSFAEERAGWEERLRLAAGEVATAKAACARAEQAQAQAQERAAGLEAGLAALQESLAAGVRDREALQQQINALQTVNAEAARQYEQTVGDLRRQVGDAVTRYEGMEKHMLLQIDRARQDRDDAKAKAADDQRMADARRVRDSNEIERLRTAGEEARDRATRLEAELQQALANRSEVERRLSVAEGQVDLLTRKTEGLATTQGELQGRLLAAEQREAGLLAERSRLAGAAATLVTVAGKVSEAPKDAGGLARLGRAAAALQVLLPT